MTADREVCPGCGGVALLIGPTTDQRGNLTPAYFWCFDVLFIDGRPYEVGCEWSRFPD